MHLAHLNAQRYLIHIHTPRIFLTVNQCIIWQKNGYVDTNALHTFYSVYEALIYVAREEMYIFWGIVKEKEVLDICYKVTSTS